MRPQDNPIAAILYLMYKRGVITHAEYDMMVTDVSLGMKLPDWASLMCHIADRTPDI